MLNVRICVSTWPGFTRILSKFSFMVTDFFNEGTAFSLLMFCTGSGGPCRLLGMREKMDDLGAIVFSSSDKGGHAKMFSSYSDVTNPRKCFVKKLSISWIVQKLMINEKTHAWKRKCTITTHLGRIPRKGI
jgi:hypothetical protein